MCRGGCVYTVVHNLAHRNVFGITSERDELGAPNFADLSCNKLTMFFKTHQIYLFRTRENNRFNKRNVHAQLSRSNIVITINHAQYLYVVKFLPS